MTTTWVLVSVMIAAALLVAWRLAVHAETRLLLVGWVPVVIGVAGGTSWSADRAARAENVHQRSLVEGMAPTYARELELHGHGRLTNDAPADDPLYLELIGMELRWLEANPAIADVYTMRQRPDGAFFFVVDAETDYDHNGRFEGEREARTVLGEVYEDVTDAHREALAGTATFDEVPVTDRWGTWVSTYVPMRDESGRVEAILGVDFPAEDWVAGAQNARANAVAQGTLFLVLLGVVFSSVAQVPRERAQRERDVALLQGALEAAKVATRARTELLHTVSHEIRNPLSGVLGMTELLLETHLDPDQRHCTEAVHRSGQLLRQTLDGVLDFAKIEAGAIEYESTPTDIRELAGTVVQLFSEAARRKKLELFARIDPAVPDRLRLDPTRVRQVLVNLVANAVKFTVAGEVELDIRWERTHLHIEVRDSGIGIAKAQLPQMFQPFHQAEGGATTRRFGGTGLGLFISKGLVTGMGGTLGVTSEVQRGTTFSLDLPTEVAPSDPTRRTTYRGRTVLVVDPHPGAADALAALVHVTGATAIAASDLATAERACAAHRPDLVLVDATTFDRSSGSLVFRSRTVVPVTASPLTGGISRVLRKPAAIGDVRRLLAEVFDAAPRQRDRTAVPVSLLVIEANPINQSVIPALFRNFGCGVEVATTAAEGAAALQRGSMDLVFIGTGFTPAESAQFVTAARTVSTSGDLPVVALETVPGADERVAWPLRPDQIEQLLKRWIPGAFRG